MYQYGTIPVYLSSQIVTENVLENSWKMISKKEREPCKFYRERVKNERMRSTALQPHLIESGPQHYTLKHDFRPLWLTKSPFLYRRPANLSASGTGCTLLRRDQIPKIRRGPPSVDHRNCRERKPHCSHHWQTADHRGGTAGSHAECQPNSRCNFLIPLCRVVIDRKPKSSAECF